MAFFQIAGLAVRMEPLYAQLTATARKFQVKPSVHADIVIPYTADHYKKFARTYPSVSLSDAENICTSNFLPLLLSHLTELYCMPLLFCLKGAPICFQRQAALERARIPGCGSKNTDRTGP